MNDKIKLFYKETPVEGNAIEQLKQTAQLEGMVEAVAMPDLHAGKGHPIGAAFLTEDIIYPYLVGNDIGCGMSLSQLDILTHKVKRDKLVRQLGSLEYTYEGSLDSYEESFKIKLDKFQSSLGTIGSGNHFFELQVIEKIINKEIFDKYKLDNNKIFMMVHSGSRGLGKSILSEHIMRYNSKGLRSNTPEYENYIKQHDYAVEWAKVNRAIIAQKAADNLGLNFSPILDIVHNMVEPYKNGYLHRKGVAPADKGLIVIPGSRGDFSYIVEPISGKDNLDSLAHGAGRKWKRSESRERLSHKYSIQDLEITDLKSQVICEDKDLMYEEAPQNYKKISKVIEDLESFGLIRVVAILKPVLTYKKKKSDDCC